MDLLLPNEVIIFMILSGLVGVFIVFIRMIEIFHKRFFGKLYFSLSLLRYGSEIVLKDISYVYRISNGVIIISQQMDKISY